MVDQIRFCDSNVPGDCEYISKLHWEQKERPSGKIVFDLDLKQQIFNGDEEITYDTDFSRLPVKMQTENCLCDWRLCNSNDRVLWNWFIIAISTVFNFGYRNYVNV